MLLADQRMPEMSGAELCATVKQRFPDVIRMILTAYSDIGSVVEAINGGQVSRYFIKPWREEELADAIRAGIDAFQLVTVTRDLQIRLLQQEQQSTTTYLLGRILHEVVSPAIGIRDNLGFVVDSVTQLARMAADSDPDVPRIASDLVPALTDAHESAIDLVGAHRAVPAGGGAAPLERRRDQPRSRHPDGGGDRPPAHQRAGAADPRHDPQGVRARRADPADPGDREPAAQRLRGDRAGRARRRTRSR